MIKVLIIFSIIFVCISNLCGAELNCSEGSSDVEKIICNNPDISRMNDEIEELYNNTQNIEDITRKQKIIESQKRWESVRNRCSDIKCVKRFYKKRIIELKNILSMLGMRDINDSYIENVEKKIDGLKENQIRYICDNIIKLTNNGSVVDEFYKFRSMPDRKHEDHDHIGRVLYVDYNEDGVTEVLGIYNGGGSCHNCNIVDPNAPKDISYSNLVLDEIESIKNARWGACDKFLFVDDEPIILTGINRNKQFIAKVAWWVSNNGSTYPICKFKTTGDIEVRVSSEYSHEVCNKVYSQSIKPRPWNKSHINPDSYPRWFRGIDALDTSFDIDMDGLEERIALIQYASSSGCGYYSEWFWHIDQAGNMIEESKIANMLKGLGGPMSGYGPAYWSKPKLFRLSGKNYILASTKYSPASVVSFYNGKRNIVCEFDLLPRQQIEKTYQIPR